MSWDYLNYSGKALQLGLVLMETGFKEGSHDGSFRVR